MPQCQKSRRHFEPSVRRGHTWTCPGFGDQSDCPGAETYVPVEPWLSEWFERAVEHAEALLGTSRAAAPNTLLLLGEYPLTTDESNREEGLGYVVYLARNSDESQLRYTAAHEAVHRVLGSTNGTWAHEMFAEMFAVRFLRRMGVAHADRVESWHSEEAGRFDLRQLLNLQGTTTEQGELYCALAMLGRDLESQLGFDRVVSLTKQPGTAFQPDLAGWLRGLGPDEIDRIQAINPDWIS